MGLDKFYTKDEVAKQCVQFLYEICPEAKDQPCIEPSAGAGAFLPYLPAQTIAYDIAPEKPDIIEQDFLTLEPPQARTYTIVGNPPFGKRSRLAVQFFNHAAQFGDIIAFILPVSFMKWSVQKQLASDFALVAYRYLEPESFLCNSVPYSVRCVFQIWKRGGSVDLRLKSAPPTSHPDFRLWQYNATPEAERYVDEPWEYAVYRQGFKDYRKLFTQNDKEEIRRQMANGVQFFFIRPLTREARNFVESCDFENLAARNTAILGFGKADFISYYMEKGDVKCHIASN